MSIESMSSIADGAWERMPGTVSMAEIMLPNCSMTSPVCAGLGTSLSVYSAAMPRVPSDEASSFAGLNGDSRK